MNSNYENGNGGQQLPLLTRDGESVDAYERCVNLAKRGREPLVAVLEHGRSDGVRTQSAECSFQPLAGPYPRIRVPQASTPAANCTLESFSRESKTRRGAGLDLALAGISIEFSDDEPLILPEAITPRPIASAASLRLADAHRLLAERGVEMTRDRERMLWRPVNDVGVRVMSDNNGFVSQISVGWWPIPGGWFYSEENETGVWVTGPSGT